jgi:tetratricopeptide (TPR) repeat protein
MQLQTFTRAALLAILTATVSTPLMLPILLLPETSQVLAQTQDARKAEADWLLNQGNGQLAAQKFKPIPFLEPVLNPYHRLKDLQEAGQMLKSIGHVHTTRKDDEKVIKSYRQSWVIAQKLENPELETLSELGKTYYLQYDYDKVIEIYQQILVMSRGSKNVLKEMEALFFLAGTYLSQGNFDQAIEFSQQGIQFARKFENERIRPG